MMGDPAAIENADCWRKRLIAYASLEITVRDGSAASVLGEYLPRGSRIHVTYLAGVPYLETVAQAKALAAAGFEPIPHLAARSLASRAELDDYLARLAGEAGATRVLLVAGDLERARGPYEASLDVMHTDLLQAHGMRGVSLAAHPEGHPTIAREMMEQALIDKLAYGEEHGLEIELVSQFCFEDAPILAYLAALRARGMAVSVRIGAAAPTDAVRLMKFAIKCGVGPSLRALQRQAPRLGQLVGAAGPETLIADIAKGLAAADNGDITGMHFFVFGNVEKAARWLHHLRHAH